MAIINKVTVITTYTRPNTDFPWHEHSISDPSLSALNDLIVDHRWDNYVGQKSVRRSSPDPLTMIIAFVWFNEETYNIYKSMAMTQEYEPALKAYYEANGGSVTETVEITVNEQLSTP